MQEFSGVVFDMDGVLVNSEPVFRMAAQRAALELGYELSDQLYVELMGMPRVIVEKLIHDNMGDEFPMDPFRDGFMRYWLEHTDAHGLDAMTGMLDLIEDLLANDIRIAVATSTRREQALRSLALAGFESKFATIIAGDDIENGKPEPDIFLNAAASAGIDATRCVAVEDSVVGVMAATAAKMHTIMVPEIKLPPADLAQKTRYILPSTGIAADVIRTMFSIG
ncbi:MAG: HAD family phosphatase [Pseudomonadota bacterium]